MSDIERRCYSVDGLAIWTSLLNCIPFNCERIYAEAQRLVVSDEKELATDSEDTSVNFISVSDRT